MVRMRLASLEARDQIKQSPIYKINSQREFAVMLRKLKQGLCTNLEGWSGEGDSFKGEGIYVYLWLIHVEV